MPRISVPIGPTRQMCRKQKIRSDTAKANDLCLKGIQLVHKTIYPSNNKDESPVEIEPTTFHQSHAV